MTRAELQSLLRFIERTRAPAIDCLGVRAEDPIWGMILFLIGRHLAGQLVTISSLAAASGIPYATAMRRIGELFAAGLLLRRPRGRTGKSFAIEPSLELLRRVESFAGGVKARVGETLGMPANGEAGYYFGGAYLAARIIAPPEPLRGLGRGLGPIRMLVKRQPSFNAIVRLRATLEQLTGCRLEITVLELEELLSAILENRKAPSSAFDIASFTFAWLGELVAANALMPLDDLLDPLPAGICDFYPAAWEAAQLDGRQYGIPIEPTAELLCYRQDLFAEAGLEAPRSADAVREAGRRLQAPARGRYGISWNAARGPGLGQTYAQVLAAFGQPLLRLRRRGEQVDLGALEGEALRPSLDTAEALAAADYLLGLVEISPPEILTIGWDERLQAFATGRVAMSYLWSSRVAEFELDPASVARGRTGYLPHPSGRPGWSLAPAGGFAIGLPANLAPGRIQPAWRLAQWLTSPSLAKLIAVNGASVSPRFSVAADPEVLSLGPVIGVVDGLAKTGQLQHWPHPPVAEFSRIIQILGEELHVMLSAMASPAAALAAAQARIDRMMRTAGHY